MGEVLYFKGRPKKKRVPDSDIKAGEKKDRVGKPESSLDDTKRKPQQRATRAQIQATLNTLAANDSEMIVFDPTTPPDRKPGVTAIVGGSVKHNVNPAALSDAQNHASRRGQAQLYRLFLAFESTLSDESPRKIEEATQKIAALRNRVESTEENPWNIFAEVTKILLEKVFGKNYGRYLNDRRINAIIDLMKNGESSIKIEAVLQNYFINIC